MPEASRFGEDESMQNRIRQIQIRLLLVGPGRDLCRKAVRDMPGAAGWP